MEFEKIRNSCKSQLRRILWDSFRLFYATNRIIPNHSSALNGIGFNDETKHYHFANPKQTQIHLNINYSLYLLEIHLRYWKRIETAWSWVWRVLFSWLVVLTSIDSTHHVHPDCICIGIILHQILELQI